MQVVDDDQIELLLFRSETARLRAHFEDADAGSVVEKDLRVSEDAERLRNLGPFESRKKTVTKALRVDVALRAQHAHDQRFLRHFKREHTHDGAGVNGCILSKHQR